MNATAIRTKGRLREAAHSFASELLAWAVETAEDLAAALLCRLFCPKGLHRHLSREEKRAFYAELVVGAVGRRFGLRLGMIFLGPVREGPGVLSFPVGARSFPPSEAQPDRRCGRRSKGPGRDPEESPSAYKVLDAVLLRKRSSRGLVKTETLVWRVALRDGDGEQTAPAEIYADREGGLLNFYRG